MKFTNKHGNNDIALGMSDAGSYLRYKDAPTTVLFNFYEYEDIEQRFYCNLPYNQDYRNVVNEKIPKDLNENFQGRLDELHQFSDYIGLQ